MRDSAAGKMTSQMPASLGPSGGVAAGLLGSGGFGVTQPCALVACSLLVTGQSSEMNDSVFAVTSLETGGIGNSESSETVGYSILPNNMASPTLYRLHFVISDFNHQVLMIPARQLFGDYSRVGPLEVFRLMSDEPAPASLTVFESSRVSRSQGASQAPYFG